MIRYALLPIIIVTLSNVFYNICAKETSSTVNPYASLCVTYVVAAVFCALIFLFTSEGSSVAKEVAKMNWGTPVLALCIIGLEVGYILLYRSGWPINIGSLVTNTALAVILLGIGFLLYHEQLTLSRLVGIVFCCTGLVLVVR